MTRINRAARDHMAATLSAVAAGALALGALAGAPASAQEPLAAERLANGAPYSFADLIEQVSPAVVSINVVTEQTPFGVDGQEFEFDGLPDEFRDFFRDFQRRFDDQMPREGRALGSGFIISPDGLVVTNHHVVNNATNIMVELKEGEEYTAELLGADRDSDLAVLRIERDEAFPFVEFADDSDLRVGDWVVAVGNPFGFESTATAGIVSALGRDTGAQYNDFIQIDAPINRGNSGGPTFDLSGRVVGVNSQIFSPTGSSVGIGLAIPADVAAKYTKQIIDSGRVVRGWLGVYIQNVDEDIAASLGLEDGRGAIVTSVTEGSPAEEAGFEYQDVVLAVGGDEVEDATDLTRRVGDLAAGDNVRFRVLRNGREQTIRVRIGERPTDPGAGGGAQSDEGEGEDDLFGMSLSRLTEEDRRRLSLEDDVSGVLVDNIHRDSVALEKGLREGDVITEVGGEPVDSAQDLRRALKDARDNDREAVLLLVHTAGGPRFVALPIEEE